MYFKRLEIFGFKSFADKTVLNFEPGVTAIVGPNGCGKSNIFDSIRWVLGEQSAKELRGSSMEDVIFNGTDKKPALGFAEVSLTFDNASRLLAIEENEVTVTRRLFRSGESEYLLNKSVVRLKDIMELIMGTGIGAESYSLVQQGKVDLVVSAKPEERRIIFDEASGITKYKAKKREALNKLKETDNNLLRINDIIVEVKRQIASIERQANKARRYKEAFEQLKGLEVQLAQYQLKEFDLQNNAITELLSELKNKENSFNQETEEMNILFDQENELLDNLEEKVSDVQSEEIKLDGQIDIDTRQIGFNEERIQNLAQNEARLTGQKNQLIERCRLQQEKIEGVKQTLLDLSEKVARDAKLLKDKKETLSTIASTIKNAQNAIKNDEEKTLETTSKQVHIKNNLTDVIKETQGILARKRRLEVEQMKVSSEKVEVDNKFENISSQINQCAHKINLLKEEESVQNQIIEELKKQLVSLENVINELEKKQLFLISQKDFIEKLQVQYHDIPDPIIEGHLFTNIPPSEKHTGIIGKVKGVNTSDANKGGIWGNIFNQNQNEKLYEIICEAKFIELDPKEIELKINAIVSEVQIKEEEKRIILAKSEEQVGLLSQMIGKRQEVEKEFSVYEAQKNDVTEETRKLVGELELLETEILEANESLESWKKKEEELSFQLDSLNQDIQWCQFRIKENQEFITQKINEREEITVAIAQLETEIESDKDKQRHQQDNLNMFCETLDRELDEIKKIDDEVVGQFIKKEEIKKNIQQLVEKIEGFKNQKEAFKLQLSEYQKQRDEVAQKLNSIRAHVAAINKEIEGIRKNLHAQMLIEQELSYKQQAIKDRMLQTYKVNMDEVTVSPVFPDIQQGQQAESIVQTFDQQQNPENQTADIFAPKEALAIVIGSEEFLAEIEKLKKRCESYGSVNLVAIEEFDQLRERFEFLTKQQSDLLTAKDSLHNTISKINRTTRQLFLETFTRVSEEFRIYFRMLFGGGEAQLVLLDPENVLESGIEIIARPPGKKLQNISLLSGGEKTLTAIALIFGVFKVNPSPFCVLDEIDAALDESNVGRFAYLLKDFAKIAQFIVITHNKKTITNADVMYGITMQERGVSKIVSVKFPQREEDKETAEVPAGV